MKLQFNGKQDNCLVVGGESYLFRCGETVEIDDKEVKKDKGLLSFFMSNGTITEVKTEEVAEVVTVSEETKTEVKAETKTEVKTEEKTK